jgi:outer membrane receptor protein involved in Fe transport
VNHLFAPNSILEGRLNQVDARLSKNFHVGHGRIQPTFDLYNLFNASTITQVNTTYGQTWLTPRGVLPGRLFKLGVQIDF